MKLEAKLSRLWKEVWDLEKEGEERMMAWVDEGRGVLVGMLGLIVTSWKTDPVGLGSIGHQKLRAGVSTQGRRHGEPKQASKEGLHSTRTLCKEGQGQPLGLGGCLVKLSTPPCVPPAPPSLGLLGVFSEQHRQERFFAQSLRRQSVVFVLMFLRTLTEQMELTAPEVDIAVTKTTTTTRERNDSIFVFLGELNQAERLLLASTSCPWPVPPLPAQGQNEGSRLSAHMLLVSISG